jgi:hypothetical protein
MADSKIKEPQPFPEWLKQFLGDVHSISKAKKIFAKHAEQVEISWKLDEPLCRKRQKLEQRILKILEAFIDQMQHHNWVDFIESSTAGHETLKPHIDSLYDEMHTIKCEYEKYTDFLAKWESIKKELEEKEATLEDALQHMKFTEKHLHYLDSDKDDYTTRQIRKSMYWDGWK